MAWSASRVAKRGDKRAVGLWLTQLAFNAAWSPLFFGAHRPRAALADVGLTLASASAYTWRARKTDVPAAIAMVPYLSWLAFASGLNASIVRKNSLLLRG